MCVLSLVCVCMHACMCVCVCVYACGGGGGCACTEYTAMTTAYLFFHKPAQEFLIRGAARGELTWQWEIPVTQNTYTSLLGHACKHTAVGWFQ